MIAVLRSALHWTLGSTALFLLFLGLLIPVPVWESALKLACRGICWASGMRVRVDCDADLDAGPYVFIGNHVNLFDGFVYGGYLPGKVRGIELDDHFRWPIYGFMIKRVGNIPISHKFSRDILRSYEHAAAALRRGTSVLILPEGTRTRTGGLEKFSRAPFVFSQDAACPLVPMALVGAYEVKTRNSWLIRPGTVTLRIGAPLDPEQVKSPDSKTLRDGVRARLEEMLSAAHG